MEEMLSNKERLNSEFLAKAVIKLLKKDIFERFVETGALSEEDQEFCDEIGWYPVDEMELKVEYADKLKSRLKEPVGKTITIKEFNNLCDSL